MELKGLQYFWPSVLNLTSAKKAAQQGFVAAIFISGATAFFLVYHIVMADSYDTVEIYSSLIGNILPMAILAFLIIRMSRIAAIAALLLSCGELLYKLGVHNSVGLYPLFVLFFINSVRATFAYHRLLQNIPRSTQALTNESKPG